MRDLLVALIIFGSIPFIFRRPFIGALMWCWISYMVPHRLGWGFVNQLPVAMVIALCFLAAFALSKEPKTAPLRPPITMIIVLLVWMSITTLVAPPDAFKVDQFIKVLKIQLITFVIYILLTSRARIEQTLWVIAASIGFYGFKGGLFTISRGGESRVWGPPGGFFEGNNELGLTLLMNIPILTYLILQSKNRWIKLGLLAVILTSVFSILGTHSRGALVAGISVALFLWLKSPRKMLFTLIFVLALPVAFVSMPESWHERMSTIVADDREDYDSSVQGRFNAWEMAFNLAKDKLFGGGFAATSHENFALYAPDPTDVHDSHSIYFQMMGQHGFIGLTIFLILGWLTWRSANNTIRLVKNDPEYEWAGTLARMLQCSLVAFGTGGAFLGLAYFDLPYHIIITLVAVENLVRDRVRATRPGQPFAHSHPSDIPSEEKS
ncbi:putative O-glycosylation ligase, exosortase A system-associated [Motiliproteus sediminis]|uniref:putative O-glycosylation ligase, exosortase A system-associated n=1 Tax=Motiliproteus sediminis TaxID=1468178 RepID=UPI001AF00E40|nr:putative O-glycosylation ligase, exosortase A system-associated [Motiliproteus sediminis]